MASAEVKKNKLLAHLQASHGRSKYGNTWTEYNGTRYQSKAEADYARELDLRVRSGDVLKWERQVEYRLDVNGHHICTYRADFKVLLRDFSVEIIDVKGARSGAAWQMFQVKAALYNALREEKGWPMLRIV